MGARFSQTKPYVIGWVRETLIGICIFIVESDDVDIYFFCLYIYINA